MKVSEFKKIADALARFATTREKAQGPESLIGVQLRGETLKFIAGNSRAGMVYSAQEHESPEGNLTFVILARPFLQAAKVLPSKQEVTLVADADGVHLQAPGGGSFDIEPQQIELRDAGFAKKPKGERVRGNVDVKTLKRMSKLFKAISAKVEVPTVQIIEGVGYATAVSPGNRPTYASYRFPAESREGTSDEYSMAAYRDFWEALTHFTEDGVLIWDKDGVRVVSGNAECFSAPYLTSSWDEETRTAGPPTEVPGWPILIASEEADVNITIERNVLKQSVQGQAPFDELNRVTLQANTDSLRIMPYGSSSGIEVPAEVDGKGFRSVNADYLNSLLNAIDAKVVTLRWSGGVPAVSISAEDYDSWTILLAPVTL